MINNIFDDMFRMLDLAYDPEIITRNRVPNVGLKGIISKPHNLYTEKDKDGNVTEWRMDMVYTPFSKEDIKVNVNNGVLSVEIGNENLERDENLVYQGISNQYSKFALRLSDNIDTEKITAKAEDGMLRINMPVKAKDENEDIRTISVL